MMITYEGYKLPSSEPSSEPTAYTLDYRCPSCGSENVTIDTSIHVPRCCDGGPSTHDEISTWNCSDCNHSAIGNEFVARRIRHEEK